MEKEFEKEIERQDSHDASAKEECLRKIEEILRSDDFDLIDLRILHEELQEHIDGFLGQAKRHAFHLKQGCDPGTVLGLHRHGTLGTYWVIHEKDSGQIISACQVPMPLPGDEDREVRIPMLTDKHNEYLTTVRDKLILIA